MVVMVILLMKNVMKMVVLVMVLGTVEVLGSAN